MEAQKKLILQVWEDRTLLSLPQYREAIEMVIEELDKGRIRVARPEGDGWVVNEWVKKAVILYFPIRKMETLTAGPLEFHDKIPLKKGYKKAGGSQDTCGRRDFGKA